MPWFFAAHPALIPRALAHPVGTIAATAFALGALAGVCAPGLWALVRGMLTYTPQRLAPLQVYLFAWSCFHVLEFVVTAYWSTCSNRPGRPRGSMCGASRRSVLSS